MERSGFVSEGKHFSRNVMEAGSEDWGRAAQNCECLAQLASTIGPALEATQVALKGILGS